jgi:hypothetical protein
MSSVTYTNKIEIVSQTKEAIPAFAFIDPNVLAQIGTTITMLPFAMLNPIFAALNAGVLLAAYVSGVQDYPRKIEQQTLDKISQIVQEECAKQNVQAWNIRDYTVKAELIEVGRTLIIFPTYQLKLTINVTFDSDKPFTESPIPVWAILIVKAIITAVVTIILGIIIAELFFAWLTSMTVKTSTVTTTKTTIDPKTGLPVTTTTTETTTEPAIGGMLTVAAVIIVIIIILLMFFVGTGKFGKKKANNKKAKE